MFVCRSITRCCHVANITRTHRRNLRGVRRLFRQSIPKYKNSLTGLRSWQEMSDANPPASLADLWKTRMDFYKLYLPPNQAFVLLEALFNPNNDVDRLLRIIDDNLQTMNSFHLAASFEAIHDMLQLGACDSDTVLVSPELRNLCKRTLYKLRFFDADEVLKLVKCLSAMRLSEDTLIVQAALKMTGHLINDFTIEELPEVQASLANLEMADSAQKSLLAAVRQATSLRLSTLIHKDRVQIEEPTEQGDQTKVEPWFTQKD